MIIIKDLLLIICVCVSVFGYMICMEAKGGSRIPGARFPGCFEVPNVGAENQNQVLY